MPLLPSHYSPKQFSPQICFPPSKLPFTITANHHHYDSRNFLQLRLEWWRSSITLALDTREVTWFSTLKKILHHLHRESRNWRCRWRDDWENSTEMPKVSEIPQEFPSLSLPMGRRFFLLAGVVAGESWGVLYGVISRLLLFPGLFWGKFASKFSKAIRSSLSWSLDITLRMKPT